MGYLIIGRKTKESFSILDTNGSVIVEVEILAIKGQTIKLGIKADNAWNIARNELLGRDRSSENFT